MENLVRNHRLNIKAIKLHNLGKITTPDAKEILTLNLNELQFDNLLTSKLYKLYEAELCDTSS